MFCPSAYPPALTSFLSLGVDLRATMPAAIPDVAKAYVMYLGEIA